MEHNDTLKKAWEETDKTPFIGILGSTENENISDILSGQEKWAKAFANGNKQKILICPDERVQPALGEFKVGIAGQLILCPPEERDKFIQSWKGKIKAVRSHDGCGAAGVAWSKLSEDEKNSFLNTKFFLDPGFCQDDNCEIDNIKTPDLYGAYHSYDLGKKLEASFEHTPFSAMRGYKEFHDARIIFWSADPTFDPSGLVDNFLPPHFLSNGLAFGLNQDYCKEELKILSGIALGDHGFGELFTKDSPFYVICVGKDEEKSKELCDNAKDVLKEFGERVIVKFITKQPPPLSPPF